MKRMKIINLKFLKEQWREELHILRNEPFKLSISFATGVFIGIIKFGKPLIIGSFICAFLGGVISFLIVYFVALRMKRNENR